LKLKTNPPTVFAAVAIVEQLTYVFACVEGKILRSLDAGETWKAADLGSPAPVVTSLVVSPGFAADGTLLAATMQDGIFCSTDRGVSWTGWNFGLFDPNVNALAYSQSPDNAQVFAGTQSGIFVSSNAGRSWNELDFPIDLAPVISLATGLDGKIFAGTEAGGLYSSGDEGKSWQKLADGAVAHILADQKDNLLIIRDGKIMSSKNQGKTWRVRKANKIDPACIAAPFGLEPARPLLVGSSNGEIITL
jgi:photosystem II stability/assembly factor-like uncharacterized protein